MTTTLQGSFRGVPFGLFGHSMESGRRVAVHEFPFRDVPFAEDMGLKARSFSLDMFVLGDDAQAQRASLQKALETKGPGILVHPYLGSVTVQVTGFSLSESVGERRLASFSVTFVQSGKLVFPGSVPNPVGSISAASTKASLHAASRASAIDTRIPLTSSAMTSLVKGTVAAVQTSAKQAAKPSTLKTIQDRVKAIDAMSAYVRDLSTVAGLVGTPDLMSYVLSDTVFRLSSLGMSQRQAFAAYQRLAYAVQGLLATLNYPISTAGLTMAANAALMRDVVYTSVISSAATCAVDAEFTTYDEAVSVRTQLASLFDLAMAEVTDDTLFGYLQDLRAQSLTQIPRPGEDLPSIVSGCTAGALPSLVLAYDLMGGNKSEQRILDLNAVRNPWFVPNESGAPVLIFR